VHHIPNERGPNVGACIQGAAQVLVAGVAQSVNYVVSLGVASVLPQLIHQIDAFIGAVAATLFSYSGQRFFTFAPKSSAGAKAPTNQA